MESGIAEPRHETDATEIHPNLALLGRLGEEIPTGLANAQDLFTDDFVWHYINPHWPEVDGDYAGVDGLRSFFAKLGTMTGGTFQMEPPTLDYLGDELVTFHAIRSMTLDGGAFAI